MRGWLAVAALAMAGATIPGAAAQPRELAYGGDPFERLDFHTATGARGPAPLIVFVHGGAWAKGDKSNATGAGKIAHFTARGYAFATINYRLVPSARVEDQAADVAGAVAWLRMHARELGVDPGRIVLMGHSAGAHLVALVSTDPQWLKRAGLGLDAVRGAVLLDGAAYDVAGQLARNAPLLHQSYVAAFDEEPSRQRALSPTAHAAAPDVANFLILHVDRDDGRAQSEALAAALRKAGANVELDALEGRGLIGHMAINRRLGDPDYPATAMVDRWVDALVR